MPDQNEAPEDAGHPRPAPSKLRGCLVRYAQARGPLFWALFVAAAVILVVYIGSQIAHDRGQTVEWYAGFGQWLGAIGSFAAAVAAVWIATSDRRRADQIRVGQRNREDADLARQAGLVTVTAKNLVRRSVGPPSTAPSISIMNRRSEPIFDVEIVKFVLHGDEQSLPLQLDVINGFVLYPYPEAHEEVFPTASEFPGIRVESDQLLGIHHPRDMESGLADYVAIAYTDRSGRRWQVDTNRVVRRI